MTKNGEEFTTRWQMAEGAKAVGVSPFAAIASSLEDDDWLLVVAAMRRMCKEIQDQ